MWFFSFMVPMVMFLQRPDGTMAPWRRYGFPSSCDRIIREFSDPLTQRRLFPGRQAIPTAAEPCNGRSSPVAVVHQTQMADAVVDSSGPVRAVPCAQGEDVPSNPYAVVDAAIQAVPVEE